jgi:hypothetical protein
MTATKFVREVDAALTRAGFTEAERQAFRVAECKHPGDLTACEIALLERYETARYADGGAS